MLVKQLTSLRVSAGLLVYWYNEISIVMKNIGRLYGGRGLCSSAPNLSAVENKTKLRTYVACAMFTPCSVTELSGVYHAVRSVSHHYLLGQSMSFSRFTVPRMRFIVRNILFMV